MRLPYAEGVLLTRKASEKVNEERAFTMWVQLYGDMVVPRRRIQDGNKVRFEPVLRYLPFDDYLEKLKKPAISHRPAEEILAEYEEITKRLAERKAREKVNE